MNNIEPLVQRPHKAGCISSPSRTYLCKKGSGPHCTVLQGGQFAALRERDFFGNF